MVRLGAGPSGIAASFSLAQKVAQSGLRLNLNITIIEQEGWIGGRMVPIQNENTQTGPPFELDFLSLIGPEEVANPNIFSGSTILRSLSRDISGLPGFFETESRLGM
jgi:hypothetical protein